jgi:hypothetical protein
LWDSNIDFINERAAIFTKGSHKFLFDIKDSYYLCTVKDEKNNILIKFKDTISSDIYSQGSLDSFERVFYIKDKNKDFVETKLYRYINGEVVYYEKYEKCQFISGIQDDESLEADKGSIPFPAQRIVPSLAHSAIRGKSHTGCAERLGNPKFYSTSIISKKSPKGKKTYLIPLGQEGAPALSDSAPQSPKIITMDYETRMLKSDILEVISCAIYDGSNYKTFYLSEFVSSKDLIERSIEYLLDPKYLGWQVYIHNLSFFDGIFMLKAIANLKLKGFEVKMIYKDGKMIVINIFKYKEISEEDLVHTSEKEKRRRIKPAKEIDISLKDSFLLLPASLKKLAKSFAVQDKFDFDTSNNDKADLNDTIFKESLLKYNKQDCKSLYDILIKFNTEILDLFKVYVFDSPTLPSLAFNIYKNSFMTNKEQNRSFKIPIATLELYNSIAPAYRGGAVDVYRPYGKDLFYYDVNSLYPSVMKKFPYPVGNYEFFEGFEDLKDLFGIVYCKIVAPKNIYAAILLTRVHGKTIAPTGAWYG